MGNTYVSFQVLRHIETYMYELKFLFFLLISGVFVEKHSIPRLEHFTMKVIGQKDKFHKYQPTM